MPLVAAVFAFVLWWAINWLSNGALGPRAYILTYVIIAFGLAVTPNDDRIRDRRFKTGWRNNEAEPEDLPGRGITFMSAVCGVFLWWYWNDIVASTNQSVSWLNTVAIPFFRAHLWVVFFFALFAGPLQSAVWARKLRSTSSDKAAPLIVPKELTNLTTEEIERIHSLRAQFAEKGLEWQNAMVEAEFVERERPLRRNRDGSIDFRQRHAAKVKNAEDLSESFKDEVSLIHWQVQSIRDAALKRLEDWRCDAITSGAVENLKYVSASAGGAALVVLFLAERGFGPSYPGSSAFVAYLAVFVGGGIIANSRVKANVGECVRVAVEQLNRNMELYLHNERKEVVAHV